MYIYIYFREYWTSWTMDIVDGIYNTKETDSFLLNPSFRYIQNNITSISS